MARYNEILAGRFNRALQKFLAMKGPASLVTLGDTFTFAYSLPVQVEDDYLFSIERFFQAQGVAPGVGATGGIQLRNPIGSNVIATLESVTISAAAAVETISVSESLTGAADLTTVLSTNVTDNRQRPNSICSYSTSVASPVALGGSLWTFTLVANTLVEMISNQDQELVMTPGVAVRVTNLITNSAFRVGFRWRERFMEDSERF